MWSNQILDCRRDSIIIRNPFSVALLRFGPLDLFRVFLFILFFTSAFKHLPRVLSVRGHMRPLPRFYTIIQRVLLDDKPMYY